MRTRFAVPTVETDRIQKSESNITTESLPVQQLKALLPPPSLVTMVVEEKEEEKEKERIVLSILRASLLIIQILAKA